jgi:hypothetical protein
VDTNERDEGRQSWWPDWLTQAIGWTAAATLVAFCFQTQPTEVLLRGYLAAAVIIGTLTFAHWYHDTRSERGGSSGVLIFGAFLTMGAFGLYRLAESTDTIRPEAVHDETAGGTRLSGGGVSASAALDPQFQLRLDDLYARLEQLLASLPSPDRVSGLPPTVRGVKAILNPPAIASATAQRPPGVTLPIELESEVGDINNIYATIKVLEYEDALGSSTTNGRVDPIDRPIALLPKGQSVWLRAHIVNRQVPSMVTLSTLVEFSVPDNSSRWWVLQRFEYRGNDRGGRQWRQVSIRHGRVT